MFLIILQLTFSFALVPISWRLQMLLWVHGQTVVFEAITLYKNIFLFDLQESRTKRAAEQHYA